MAARSWVVLVVEVAEVVAVLVVVSVELLHRVDANSRMKSPAIIRVARRTGFLPCQIFTKARNSSSLHKDASIISC